MRKLLFIFLLCLITTSAFGQFQQKPLLGLQIDPAHQLGDPIALWLFNEGSGSKVFDLSGNGNTGSLVADTHWVPGKFGSALEFDGTGDAVDVGNAIRENIKSAKAFTLAAWAYPRDLTIDGAVISGEYFLIWMDTGGAGDGWIAGILDSGSVWRKAGEDNASAMQDKWQFVVGTYDGSNVRIFVDGIEKDSAAVSSIRDSSLSVRIGQTPLGTKDFNGTIDHVTIYNIALTPSEIAELYREPFCMVERDDIAVMAKAAEAPPPTGGQVIMILMSAIPLFLIPFLVKRKNLGK